jgi:pyrroloquinoline quinone biosynthesis protein D
MNPNMIPRQRSGFVIEEMEGECLLYRSGRHWLVHLNETATVIWKLCDGSRTVEDIVTLLAREYPASRAEIETDVNEAVSMLIRQRVIEIVTDADATSPV